MRSRSKVRRMVSEALDAPDAVAIDAEANLVGHRLPVLAAQHLVHRGSGIPRHRPDGGEHVVDTLALAQEDVVEDVEETLAAPLGDALERARDVAGAQPLL